MVCNYGDYGGSQMKHGIKETWEGLQTDPLRCQTLFCNCPRDGELSRISTDSTLVVNEVAFASLLLHAGSVSTSSNREVALLMATVLIGDK